jgi:hypothetical protein
MPDLAIPDGYALTPPPAGATAPAGAPPPTGGAPPPTAAPPTTAPTTPAVPGTTPAPAAVPLATPAGPPPMPSREQILGRIPTTNPSTGLPVTPEQYDIAQREAMRLYNQQMQRTEETRARLMDSLKNGAGMLADGREFLYDEPTIRSLLPPEKADPIIEALGDAKIEGAAMGTVRGMTQQEIIDTHNRLQAGLETGPPTGYLQRRKEAAAFDAAATKHLNALFGKEADPANYVALNNPRIAQLQTAKTQSPQAFSDYATATLAEQQRLGVPVERQHVMTTNEAQQMATNIARNPEQAPDTLAGLAAHTGAAWPQVWSDLVTQGKLPAGYQVVGQLADYDPANASVLARAEGARNKDDQAFEKLVGAKAPGGKSIKDIADQTIPVDDRVQAYERSLEDSGASPAQVVAIRSAIEHLAAGRAIFLHEDPSEATTKAIDAVVGHYQFMPNGGGRVPADRYADVSANARTTLDRLSLGNVRVPDVCGKGAGTPSPQDYVDQLKAQGSWITGPKADRLLLMDHAGRIVKDTSGNDIAVPFAQARIVPAVVAPQYEQPIPAPF